MGNLIRVSALLLLCLFGSSYAQNSPIVDGLVKQIKSYLDPSLDPCKDFYQFACGSFLKENPVPTNITGPYLNWPIIDSVEEHVQNLLLQLVQQPWPYVNDLFLSCDQPVGTFAKTLAVTFLEFRDRIEQTDPTQLESVWALINQLNANPDLQIFVLAARSTEAIIAPTGNTLTSYDYKNASKVEALRREIVNAFLHFESLAQANQNSYGVLAVEEYIASFQYDREEITSIGNFTERTKIDWSRYFRTYGGNWALNTSIMVIRPDYFQNISKYILSLPRPVLHRYIEWKVYQFLAAVNETTLEFGAAQKEQKVVCAAITEQILPDLVGMIFVEEVMNPNIYSSISSMTTGIQSAFNASLPGLDWLDTQALAAVRFKLANIIQIIGHPNKLEKYSGLITNPENFFWNAHNILAADYAYNFGATYDKFNRSDYEFDPLIVNAFYSPNTNTINFPAGILESPIYSANWPKLFQYARLGYIVGHENTHGFDNQGSHYDAYGNYKDIFDSATRTKYTANSQCIVNAYNKYVVVGNQTINGAKTLGENIADIGGLKNSYRAYQNFIAANGAEFPDGTLIPGFSTNQIFFLVFAQTTCSVANDAYLKLQLEEDVHSPTRFRTNGPVSQFDQFAKVFNCAAGTPMNPANKCDLW